MSNAQSDFTNHIFIRIMGEFYDPSYGSTYGTPGLELIPDPQDPSQEIEVETVPIFDNEISAFYYYEIGNPNQYFIQMNVPAYLPFIFVLPSLFGENNY